MLQDQTVIPDYALKYLDVKVDHQTMILEAEKEMKEFAIAGDYDQENIEVEDDE